MSHFEVVLRACFTTLFSENRRKANRLKFVKKRCLVAIWTYGGWWSASEFWGSCPSTNATASSRNAYASLAKKISGCPWLYLKKEKVFLLGYSVDLVLGNMVYIKLMT